MITHRRIQDRALDWCNTCKQYAAPNSPRWAELHAENNPGHQTARRRITVTTLETTGGD